MTTEKKVTVQLVRSPIGCAESHRATAVSYTHLDVYKRQQKPVVTMSKKAIAGFKIRENQAIGCMVTLRGAQMYEFLDRFVTVALPRVRDFRGISGRSFDGRGNYNIGVKEQIIFPEIEYDKVDALRGLNISITTTAKTDDECKALLAGFRFPFKN